jgi:hypothetical protein
VALDLQGATAAPPTIRLGGYNFAWMESLVPELDASGAIAEFRPQGRYKNAGIVPLHEHGHGPFCKFRVPVPKGLAGVYALVVNGSVRYIGECEDLRKRFGSGYGTISPINCYKGGQRTNCKINRRVLEVAQAGGRVDLYFYATAERKTVERELLASYSPPWNGRKEEKASKPLLGSEIR